MKTLTFTLALVLSVIGARAQFGKTFAATAYVPPTVNGAYSYDSGQLAVLLETTPAGDEAHLFVDNQTGRLLGSLRLDFNHQALLHPGGAEILVTGSTTVPDPPGASQPVYFAGRYHATTLQPIGERQLAVDRTSGYNLSGQVSPDGEFVFFGSHGTELVILIARYGTDFTPQWGAALTYHGELQLLGPSVYPLANGQTGFGMYFRKLNPDGTATDSYVLGLLDATGALKWTAVAKAKVAGLTHEDFRFVFGLDGSFFASKETINFLSPDTDKVALMRIAPDGTLAYSKTLTVPGAVFEWQYYLGDRALVYYVFKEGGADRVQFIALDGSGNLTGNTALNCKLRGSGQIKLTAARRSGTDFAFARLECGLTTGSPEQTLARLNLLTGAMELRKLPQPLPGVEAYEVITTPKGDANGHNSSASALAALTTAIVSVVNVAGGGSKVGLYELPADGDFPSCLPLRASSVTPATPRAVQLTDAPHLDLSDGATVVSRAMPGMTTPLALPTIQATPVTESTLRSDEGGAIPEVVLTIVLHGDRPGGIACADHQGLQLLD